MGNQAVKMRELRFLLEGDVAMPKRPSVCEGRHLQSLDCPATLQVSCDENCGNSSKSAADDKFNGHCELLA